MAGVPVFHSPPGDARGRGRGLGEAWRPQIHAGWLGYERLFAACDIDPSTVCEVGLRTLVQVDRWAPALAEELAGIAAGAALEPWQIAALNARTELLGRYRPALPGECSTSVFLPDAGPPRTIQTWDWYDHLGEVKLVWQLEPRPGRIVKTFTEFGMLGKIGVNDAGLGVHFNVLQHADDGGEPVGVPVHVVARRILDEAATLEEAVELAATARFSASTALTVVTYDGDRCDACTLELSPAGVGRVSAADDRFVLHTNHFLDAGLAQGERLGTIEPDTYARLDALEARKAALCDPDPEVRTAALDCHREDGAALCCHPVDDAPFDEQWRTLLVIALDVANGRLVFRAGGPCDHHTWVTV
jgi:isopenicillin-N N-acyltransferase-like protein